MYGLYIYFFANYKGFTKLVSSTRLLSEQRHAKDTLVINNEEPLEAAPAEPHLIYDGPMTRQVRSLKVFSLTTSLMGLGLQPFLFQVRFKQHKSDLNVCKLTFILTADDICIRVWDLCALRLCRRAGILHLHDSSLHSLCCEEVHHWHHLRSQCRWVHSFIIQFLTHYKKGLHKIVFVWILVLIY